MILLSSNIWKEKYPAINFDGRNPGLRTIETFDGKTRTKEFYAMKPEEAYSLLESIAKISGTSTRLRRMKPEGREEAPVQHAAFHESSPVNPVMDFPVHCI